MTSTTPMAPIQDPSAPTKPMRAAWLIASAVAGLALALVAGFAIGRQTAAPEDLPGLAAPSVTAMLANRVAAVNSGPSDAIAVYYSSDAVLEEHDQQPPVITTGADAIGDHLGSYQQMGFRVQQTGTATQLDRSWRNHCCGPAAMAGSWCTALMPTAASPTSG